MLTINNCQFRENQSNTSGFGLLFVRYDFDVSLTDCSFENNISPSSSSILYLERSFGQMNRCVFKGNQIVDSSIRLLNLTGGGNYSISNSVISGNDGGGITAATMDTLTITNCTISGNTRGIYLGGAPSVILTNNIIYGNADSLNSNDLIGSGYSGTHNLIGTLNSNAFTDGVAGNIIGRQPCFAQPVPAFPTTEGDLRLRFGSLGIDAGDDNRIIDDLDVAEDDRIQGQAVNMGAYETVVPAPLILLSSNAMQITNGDTSPSPDDDTGFGAIDIGQSVSHSFGIANTGTDVLFLAGMPPVQLTGFGAGAFSIESDPDIAILPGKETTFTISFSPSFSGFHQATVLIPNNACYDDPFTFEVGGAGNPGISGNISHWNGAPATNAQVTLDINVGQTSIGRGVDLAGDYEAANLPYGANVRIIPGEVPNPGPPSCPDCIDIADLLRIRQHLLSIQPLENPYAIIAADVNNDGGVSTFDFVLIQQMILRERSTFNNTACWRYVDSAYVFPDPTDPSNPPFPESVLIDPLVADEAINFVAIKTGDVTGDCPATAPPIAGSVTADFDDCVLPGEVINVPVRASAFNGSGMQLTLSWNPDVLEFLGTGNYNIPGLAFQNFSTLNIDVGLLTMAWISDTPATLPAGAILFEVSFKVAGPSGSVTSIGFPDFPTPARTATAFPITTFAPLTVEGLVRVGAQPVFTPLMPRETCIDAPAILLSATPSGGTFSGPGVPAGSAIFDPALAGPGSHVVEYVYETAGCQNTASDSVAVHALPPVKLFDNLPLCEGETLLLWDTSSTIIEWKWRVAGVDTITQDSILSIPFANMADDGGYYYITITDENYCQNTDSTFIIIFDKPSVEASNNSPLCAGDTLRLWGTETGGVINWRWSGPNFMANGQNQDIPAAGLAYANTYTLVGKDSNECTDTATTTVVIHALPPAGISSNSPVCEGEALILRDTSGADSLWQWAGPGLDTTLQAPEIEIGRATPAISGRYTVTVTDGKGCRNTASIDSALVYARPLVAVSSNSPLCDNEGLELSESGGVAASWNWRGPGGFYSSDNNPFVERADVTPGNFVVTIADSNGCANSASLEVTTVSGFFFESNLLTPSFIFCGDSVHFFDISEAELPDGQYFWDFGDGSSSTERDPVHVYGSSGVYTVTLQVTDANCENLSLEKELTVFGCLQRKLDFLNAYPNPSSDGNVTLEAILNGRSSLAIEVYSPTGVRLERRVLRDVLWARESFSFERSGVYFIYLLAETDREVLKVVVGKE
ncbi:MAG: choice-of-anchor D domain-containing protein [Lewinellaceae bacterium]|nr:choice-of-anchor D domain-containing protein [Phaeodactylibacter sp.]MCB9037140.1 choice-of-anchor D domain-containing protein [Lewinellaceae bacterium]